MSFQWTFIAGYLYFEVAVVILMILPIMSPRNWYRFFNSRLFAIFKHHTAIYFYMMLGVLSLFLLDAVREMRKYSHNDSPTHVQLSSEMKGNVKLFRAQRNFYITGFAIFLAFVIRRLVTMIIIQYEITMQSEKIIKEAEATVKLAKTTVLSNTIQALEKNYEELNRQMKTTQDLLEEEKLKSKLLEEELMTWKSKYEEICSNTSSVGKGDELVN